MEFDKTTWYLISGAIGAFAAWLVIDPLIFGLLTLAFVLDFITGVLRASITGEYRSKIGWVKTVAKILGMFLLLLCGMFLKLLGINHTYFIFTILMGLACHDLISALGNLYTIRTGKKLPEMDVFSLIIASVHGKLIAIIKKLFKEDENEGN